MRDSTGTVQFFVFYEEIIVVNWNSSWTVVKSAQVYAVCIQRGQPVLQNGVATIIRYLPFFQKSKSNPFVGIQLQRMGQKLKTHLKNLKTLLSFPCRQNSRLPLEGDRCKLWVELK